VPIDPSQPDQVGPALLAYLGAHLEATGLCYAEAPEPLGRGFDTYIYAFRLEGEALAAAWARPLVLRLYPAARESAKAEREGAVQRFAAARGYPAVAPLAVDGLAEPFGLPLMVMDRVEGKPMLERIGLSPPAVRRLFGKMASLHAALHRVSVDGCPLPADGSLVVRLLKALQERIERVSAHELDDALVWLEEHKGTVMPEEVSLCHNDFHPLNIMVGDDGRLTVLDWSDAALGDRHCDVARTLTLLHFAWIAGGSAPERLVLRLSRGFLRSSYLVPYRRELPIDLDRMRYWQAYHAAQGWLQMIELQDPGNPSMAGARLDAVERLPPGLLPQLRRYFWQRAKP
jgi:aminoglycoside phosphotransferase (APT) family kinase protein